MKLPAEYLRRMRDLLGQKEFDELVQSYGKPRSYGLKVNTLKIEVGEFLKIAPFKLEPIPWTKGGFYYRESETPGKHPYYHAGLYYIQEPSAMFPAEVLDARPGERILDLCAAPGGKTVQLAASMKGRGILVANDISADRAKALVKNIELCGIRNSLVTNEAPERLASKFPGYFDRIIVDAPCSGEGMFRKDKAAVRNWERFKYKECAAIQRSILSSADTMLKPGGYLAYSTCTFSPEENEIMVYEFLERHSDYEMLEVPKAAGIEGGRAAWCGRSDAEKAARLWPHRVGGEGHFTALLRKKASSRFSRMSEAGQGDIEAGRRTITASDAVEVFRSFERENLNISIDGHFMLKGRDFYLLPEDAPNMDGIRVVKFGWYLGRLLDGRFEPSHSMVLSLKREDVRNVFDFPSGSREIMSYLKGETLLIGGKKGLAAVCVDGYTVGWAKQTGDMLKNLYPKGWRRLC